MSGHKRSDIWISFGFAASFFAALLFTFLAPWNMTMDSIGAIWTIAISAAFVNHGFWDLDMGLILGGSLSVLVTLIISIMCPNLVSLGYTVIFIVKADIHREVDINIVKRFAEVIIENREREEKGRLTREVRVSNKVDNIHTEWKKF